MRIDFIDNMKALGILLVIIGHLPFLLIDSLVILIYSFHMPLFFFISGFLIGDKLSMFSPKKFIRYCLSGYIMPYIIFFCLSLFFFILALYMRGELNEFSLQVSSIVLGFFWVTSDTLNVNAVLWYFSAAWTTLVFAFIFEKLLSIYFCEKSLLLGLFILIIFIGTPLIHGGLPWNISIVHISLFFVMLGKLSKKYILIVSKIDKRNYHWLAVISLFSIVSYSSLYNGRVDLASGILGYSNALFIVNAIVMLFCVFFVASSFSATRVAQWLSLRSLIIFPLHIFAIQILTMIMKPTFENISFLHSLLYLLLYLLFVLIFSFIAEKFLSKIFPQIFK